MTQEPQKREIDILIVEDDVFLQKILAIKFGKEGFAVSLAEDGSDALAAMREKRPMLLLLDLILPRVSGFEVLSEMRTDPKLKDIPVIVLTNLGQDEDRERSLGLGAIAFLIKADLSINEVVSKVKEEFARYSQRQTK